MRFLGCILLVLVLLTGLVSLAQQPTVKVAVVLPSEEVAEKAALQSFFSRFPTLEPIFMTPYQMADLAKAPSFPVVWVHQSITDQPVSNFFDGDAINFLKRLIFSGQRLLITQEAMPLIGLLGLDEVNPQVQTAEARDEGYGRKRGLHANRVHPLFEGLGGGSFVFSPLTDTVVRRWGYFGDCKPMRGKVVAVDWAYIRMKETERLALAFDTPNGSEVLCIGAYCAFRVPNQHQPQLDRMLANGLFFLARQSHDDEMYWPRKPFELNRLSDSVDNVLFAFPKPLSFPMVEPVVSKASSDEYAGLAGERVAVFTNERSGIEEVWIHPFMALRDYRIGFEAGDSVRWLSASWFQSDAVSIRREYATDGLKLTESLIAHPSSPLMIAHYDFHNAQDLNLVVEFSSNLRLMWPYSPDAIGGIHAKLSADNQLVRMASADGQSAIMAGVNVPAKASISTDSARKQMNIRFRVKMSKPGSVDFILAGASGKAEGVDSVFRPSALEPENVAVAAYNSFSSKCSQWMTIESPDTLFNRMVHQTMNGTDRFFASTPEIGASFLAGYASTAHGWDGEQAINGRPGYAWYFGRDAQWSAMAVLAYGDFGKVKKVLQTFVNHQDVNGKIYHELTTSGATHYDAADATPLFVVLAGRYLLQSGDLETISAIWPSLRRAIDFCYSTDSDSDLLIENTGVGHGWVEGGHLFGGKTTLYLASCWAEALRMAAIMAHETGHLDDASRYQGDHEVVLRQLKHRFTHNSGKWLNHSLKTDNGFIEDETIMQAIPLLFQQIDSLLIDKILRRFSSTSFSSDWGTRIVPKESPRFNPRGYHTGSVWPLYTGWTALAEYASGFPLQGFQHVWNNLWITQFWGQGMIEEVMHGTEFRPSGVCAHQCWSHSLTIQAIIEGLAGFHPDVLRHTVTLKPALPPHWNYLTVRKMRVGHSQLDMQIERQEATFTYRFQKIGTDSLKIDFRPVIAPGAKIRSVKVNGHPVKLSAMNDLVIVDKLLVVIEFEGLVELLPLEARPLPGQQSNGIRVIGQAIENQFLVVDAECYPGQIYELVIRHSADFQPECEGAVMTARDGEFSRWRVDLPSSADSNGKPQKVKLHFLLP